MTKQELYDIVCRALTDFEGNGDPEDAGNELLLYETLIEVQNYLEDR